MAKDYLNIKSKYRLQFNALTMELYSTLEADSIFEFHIIIT